jgi:lipoprotein-anchoring transpeptidase ErfK/SrfK
MRASVRLRLRRAIVFCSLLVVPSDFAFAQSDSFGPVDRFPIAFAPYSPQTEQTSDAASVTDAASATEAPVSQWQRQVVPYRGNEAPGTIIIDTAHTFLYLTLGNGKALRYGVGVGREGFTWSGLETISRVAEWPDWIPPAEMIARQPYLPRWVSGGPGNPLGARALYLGHTAYRIHGTNDPTTIGKHVSSGCIRLRNEDVTDLYNRVGVGTKVVVLRNGETSAPIIARDRAPRPQAKLSPKPLHAQQQRTAERRASTALSETQIY